jgi:hypothetical protein
MSPVALQLRLASPETVPVGVFRSLRAQLHRRLLRVALFPLQAARVVAVAISLLQAVPALLALVGVFLLMSALGLAQYLVETWP